MNIASNAAERPDEGSDVAGTFQAVNSQSEKHTAYYSALLAAWIDTRMERDKSLLALSTAGIGLLFTLLTTVGATSTRLIVLYGLCFLSFLISIVSAVTIFSWNAVLIQCLLRNETPRNRRLDVLDAAVFGGFIAGLILTVTLGITTGVTKIKREGNNMNDGIKTTQQVVGVDGQKSLSGLEQLSPSSQGQSQSSGTTGAGTTPQGQTSGGTAQGAQPSSSQSTQGKK
jgi:hypothetical protein